MREEVYRESIEKVQEVQNIDVTPQPHRQSPMKRIQKKMG